MMLGTLLDRLNDEAFAHESVLNLGDLGLLLRVEQVAADHGLKLGEAVTHAVHSFTANADADHWVQLMGAINQADDPGSAALKQMLEVALPQQ
jgi:hypothetical protein